MLKIASSVKQERELQEDFKDSPHAWIQWKGTYVCMDVYCNCGKHFHIDDEFAYYVQCPYCKDTFSCNPHIELIKVTHKVDNPKTGEKE